MDKDLTTAIVTGVAAYFAADWISGNIAPSDAGTAERTAYRYGGAVLGAYVGAMAAKSLIK